MAENKTKATDHDVTAFLEAVEHPVRRADGLVLDAMFRQITGWTPRMWGPTIVGYGSYDYVYDSGRSGTSLATGFSPRKAALSLYIMPGYQDYSDIRDRLGKHKIGKACLYINKLADVDLSVVEELVRRGVDDLGKKYPVTGS
ncbi:DUF1801 domain-containing protein [Pseudooctadecabacter sp.]|uniref:DUF1801 domain-containing protein n=1 Tax=Pseudooctadecabacter sp. TaxID=1966338 RepID=UPI0025F92F60|nr:DUF1801 domain-containing protein [Pseudooctadecabacter sp.]